MPDIKGVLSRAWRSETQERIIKERLDNLHERMFSISSRQSDGLPAPPNRNFEGFTRIVDAYVDEERVYIEQIRRVQDYRMEANRMIDMLNDPAQKMVLGMRYLDYKTFEQIAECIEYSEKWVRQIHDDALEELKNIEATSA